MTHVVSFPGLGLEFTVNEVALPLGEWLGFGDYSIRWYGILIAIGFLLGSALSINTTGVDVAMTALFVVIAVGQWRGTKNHLPAALGAAVTLVSLQLVGKENMLILSLVVIAALLLALQRRMPADE